MVTRPGSGTRNNFRRISRRTIGPPGNECFESYSLVTKLTFRFVSLRSLIGFPVSHRHSQRAGAGGPERSMQSEPAIDTAETIRFPFPVNDRRSLANLDADWAKLPSPRSDTLCGSMPTVGLGNPLADLSHWWRNPNPMVGIMTFAIDGRMDRVPSNRQPIGRFIDPDDAIPLIKIRACLVSQLLNLLPVPVA